MQLQVPWELERGGKHYFKQQQKRLEPKEQLKRQKPKLF